MQYNFIYVLCLGYVLVGRVWCRSCCRCGWWTVTTLNAALLSTVSLALFIYCRVRYSTEHTYRVTSSWINHCYPVTTVPNICKATSAGRLPSRSEGSFTPDASRCVQCRAMHRASPCGTATQHDTSGVNEPLLLLLPTISVIQVK